MGGWFAYASEFRMDITTLLGLVAGAIVLCTLILMGGLAIGSAAWGYRCR